ncbi:MAG TPA: type II toxin-antitoxin system VapC family toxin [Vicinamibacteria bacterium]
MITYLDSSALIKLYVPEAGSKRVSEFTRALPHAVPFTHLHELEMKNGLQLKRFRGEAMAKAIDASVQAIDDDFATGVLSRPELNWFDVFRRAQELVSEHSARIGCRSLDLLHVSSALLLEAAAFLTFDERQSRLARASGLKSAAL